MQRVPGVSTTDVQGNGFVQDLRYRGFAASPLQGTPQGIAVYMNGIRVNEAFGDTVNWDLIPTNAINRTDIWTNNPMFGLNALGGAVNIQMKNGFTYQGIEVEAQGGSLRPRRAAALQYGAQKDGVGVYLAAQGVNDDGWRYQSPSQVGRFYGDVGWRGDSAEIHLDRRRSPGTISAWSGRRRSNCSIRTSKSIYTWPQTTRNDMRLVALNGKFDVHRNLVAAKQRLRPQIPAGACRRQRRRCRELQQRVRRSPASSASRTTASRCRPAARPSLPRPVRHPRRQRQSDQIPVPTTPYGTDRPDLDRRADHRRLAAGDATTPSCSVTTIISSSAAASTTAGRLRRQQRTGIYLSGSVGRRLTPASPAPARSSTRSAISATARSA